MIESIKELVTLPFDILGSFEGDAQIGFGFLMLVFLVASITVTYYVVEFIIRIYKTTLNFFIEAINSFTGIFKQPGKQKSYNLSVEDLDKIKYQIVKSISDSTDEINKSLDRKLDKIKQLKEIL